MLTDSREIRIETSTACSYNCIMCPRDRFLRKREVMPDDLFRDFAERAIAEIPELQMITVSGYGEFSLDPGWKNKLAVAASLYSRVHVVTNLHPVSRDDLDDLLDLADDIRVSLYATDQLTYHLIHRPPAGVNIEAMEEKIRYLSAHRKPGQRLLLPFLELDENRAFREDWLARWRDKADLLEVWLPHNWVNGRSYRTLCSHRMSTCGRPFHGPIQVQVDGTVNVCCFDYNGELVIGDFRKQSLQEIYEGTALAEIRELHETNRADMISLCRVCDQRDCPDCKSGYLLYDSQFLPKNRVATTSTTYEDLGRTDTP